MNRIVLWLMVAAVLGFGSYALLSGKFAGVRSASSLIDYGEPKLSQPN